MWVKFSATQCEIALLWPRDTFERFAGHYSQPF